MNTATSSWDEYFRGLLEPIASKSKDPSRKIGAIAVKDEHIVMTGFNGFPRGVEDTDVDRYQKKYKNLFTLHAEANIVSLSARRGISLEGCTVYCNLHPCYMCAKLLINAGVSSVKCPPLVLEPEGSELYHFDVARDMMREAGIKLKYFEDMKSGIVRRLCEEAVNLRFGGSAGVGKVNMD